MEMGFESGIGILKMNGNVIGVAGKIIIQLNINNYIKNK